MIYTRQQSLHDGLQSLPVSDYRRKEMCKCKHTQTATTWLLRVICIYCGRAAEDQLKLRFSRFINPHGLILYFLRRRSMKALLLTVKRACVCVCFTRRNQMKKSSRRWCERSAADVRKIKTPRKRQMINCLFARWILACGWQVWTLLRQSNLLLCSVWLSHSLNGLSACFCLLLQIKPSLCIAANH